MGQKYELSEPKLFSLYKGNNIAKNPYIRYAEIIADNLYQGYKNAIHMTQQDGHDLYCNIDFKETKQVGSMNKLAHYSFHFMIGYNDTVDDVIEVNVFLDEMICIQFTMRYKKKEE